MPTGIYERTEEHKRKLSEANRGNEGYWKNKKRSEKTKKKISVANKGHIGYWKGKNLSEEHKKMLSLNHRKVNSKEQNIKIGDSQRGIKKGTFHTIESKRKISLTHGGTGIPYENNVYPGKFDNELKEKIRKRDNYTCQLCGMTEEEHLIVYGQILTVHHIDYDKKNCKEDNLITTCRPCNSRVNFNRKYWEKHFKEFMIHMIKTMFTTKNWYWIK